MPAATAAPSRPAVRRLGTVPYAVAWDLQRDLVDERVAGRLPDTLLLLDHPPVVTLGRGGDPAHLVASAAELDARGVAFVETDRGGDVTFHGPGQHVGCPLVDVAARGRDHPAYLRAQPEDGIRPPAAMCI